MLLAALLGVYAALACLPAAPGSDLVLATAGGSPAWLLGPLSTFGAAGADGPTAGPLFLLGLAAALALYAGALARADAIPLRLVAAAVGGAHLLFLLAPPLLSQDAFSYLAYARLGALHGLDPYIAVPLDAPGDPVLGFAGSKGAPSVYGPLFTLLVRPLAFVGVPAGLWALKLLAAASSLGVAAIAWRTVERLGRDGRRAAIAVGLNPLVLVHVVAGAHNEAIVALVSTAGLSLWLSRRAATGAGVAALAFGLKASALLVVPFLLAGSRARGRGEGRGAALGVAVAAAAVLVAGFVGPASGAVEALGTLASHQAAGSSSSFPTRAAGVAGLVLPGGPRPYLPWIQGAFLIALAGVAAEGLRRVWRGSDAVTVAGWTTLVALVASGWLVPWYAMWLLPLVALSEDARLLVAAVALSAWMLPIAVPL